MNNNFFQIGDLSKKAGVSKRTIRYYEEIGLISPTKVTSGSFRLYSINDLHRLQVINNFKELGFSLEEIKNLIWPKPNQKRNKRVKNSINILKKQIESVQEQIEKLLEVQRKNEKALEMLRQCQDCSETTCPNSCPNLKKHL